jgi:hypothetical protein
LTPRIGSIKFANTLPGGIMLVEASPTCLPAKQGELTCRLQQPIATVPAAETRPYTTKYKRVHGPNCGHPAIPHGDHTDYLVNGHLHHPHGNHCDDHGPVKVKS